MKLEIPYGKSLLQTEIHEEQVEIISSKPMEPLKNLDDAIRQSLRKPIGAKPLSSLDKGKKVCIIVPDETRACPTKEILPIVLEELKGCQPAEIKIVIGNGLHRAMSKHEMIELLGEKVVEEYDVLNHVATDEKQLVDLGMKTSYGTPAIVNKIVAESDYVIGIGLVEPHFFAGYSGGRKIILPAVAGKEAIFNNHSYRMIAHPKASYGILEGNPIHLDMMEFMNFVNLSFIVNVTINNKGEVSGVFAGHPVKAHKQAVQFLSRHVNIRVNDPADIVIASNGGYPLDRDLYQAVKGMATAKRIVKEGGVIIMVAECKDGLGGHEEFRRLIQKATSPKDLLREIRENEPINDQWQAQILAMILEKAKVIVVTGEVEHKTIREMMMEPALTLEEALHLASEMITKKPKIVAIPEGPYVIPNVYS